MRNPVQSAKNRKRVAKLLVVLAMKSGCLDLSVNLQGLTRPDEAVAAFLKRPSYVKEIYTAMQHIASIGGAIDCYPEIPQIMTSLRDLLPNENMRVIEEYWAANPPQTKDERSFSNLSEIFLSSVIADTHTIRFYANLDSRTLYYNVDEQGTFALVRCKDDADLRKGLQNSLLKYMGNGLLSLARTKFSL